MDPWKVSAGALLLFVSNVVVLETQPLTTRTPLYVAAGASLVVAAGTWVADRSRQDDPF